MSKKNPLGSFVALKKKSNCLAPDNSCLNWQERNLDGISPLPGLICHSVGWAQFWSKPSLPPFPLFSHLLPISLLSCFPPCCSRSKGVTCDVIASGRAAECVSGGVLGVHVCVSVCENLLCLRACPPVEGCQATLKSWLWRRCGPLQMGPLCCAMHQ